MTYEGSGSVVQFYAKDVCAGSSAARKETKAGGSTNRGPAIRSIVLAWKHFVGQRWWRWFIWSLMIQGLLLGLTYSGWHQTDAEMTQIVEENLMTMLRSQVQADRNLARLGDHHLKLSSTRRKRLRCG